VDQSGETESYGTGSNFAWLSRRAGGGGIFLQRGDVYFRVTQAAGCPEKSNIGWIHIVLPLDVTRGGISASNRRVFLVILWRSKHVVLPICF
jgi:hypothetical protein